MLLVRVCKACNCTFEGGPHALYCQECRKLRKKEYTEKNILLKNQGESRQIGKLDLCEMCNRPYTVMSGTQRYCPECAPKAQAEKNRRQKKARYEANREAINTRRSIERKEARKRPYTCEVCGKEYFGLYAYGCCSSECAEHKRDLMKERRKAFRHRELPPDVPRLRRKIDWSSIDWQKSNAEISGETGIPMGTIWFARKRIMDSQTES